MPNPTLHIRIISPQSLLLDTEADSVSSKNSQGNFDILPQHANFITLIEDSPIVIRPATAGQKPFTFKFPVAIIMNTENKVNIYTYIQTQEKVKNQK